MEFLKLGDTVVTCGSNVRTASSNDPFPFIEMPKYERGDWTSTFSSKPAGFRFKKETLEGLNKTSTSGVKASLRQTVVWYAQLWTVKLL